MRNALALLVALPLLACGRDSTEAPKAAAPPAAEPQPAAREPVVPTETPAQPEDNTPPETTPPAADEGASASAPAAPAAKEDEPLQDGPHVSFTAAGGRAHWVGSVPQSKQLVFNTQAAEQCQHEGGMDTLDRSLMVDGGGGIANVVIEVDVQGRAVAPADAPLEMDQHGCTFLPHVLLVPAGSEVVYKNSDPFTHNVNVVARRNQPMNAMLGEDGSRTERYEKGDPMQLKCDIHPWMSAWVYVSDAPVHVLTGPDGSFALPGLPPGSHKVSCWHESLGKASGTLVVGQDGSIAELDLAIGKKR